MQNISDVCYWAGLGFSVSTLIEVIQEYRKIKAERKYLQTLPVISLPELQTVISLPKLQTVRQQTENSTESSFMVKTRCSKSFQRDYAYDVGSNQVFFNLVPLTRILQEIETNINAHVEIQDKSKDLLWRAEDRCTFKLPTITNSMILKHNVKYDSLFESEKPGSLKVIFKYTIATFAALPELILQALEFNHRRTEDVLINGPKWGTLTIGASLITNVPLILCCDLERGTVVPRYLGLTKSDILEHLQSRETKMLIYSGIFVAVVTIFYQRSIRNLFKKMSRVCSNLFRDLKKRGASARYNPEVDEEHFCIICYANCKNIVFKRCKHMILCSKCAYDETNAVVNCPLCREEVDSGEYIELMELKQ